MFESILQFEGYDVVAVRSVEEAWERLRGGFNPDLILVDLVLPEKSGSEFIDDVRSSEKYRTTPILVISALLSALEREEARNLAQGYLGKPIELDGFLAVVACTLNKNGHA